MWELWGWGWGDEEIRRLGGTEDSAVAVEGEGLSFFSVGGRTDEESRGLNIRRLWQHLQKLILMLNFL